MEWKKLKLSDISDLVSDKIDSTKFDSRNYLSTENMLPNREGYNVFDKEISEARVCAYTKGDILISNIRPYFKKIVYANVDGGCSNDVLVFRTKNNDLYDSKFLYYLLSQDLFFDYVMSGANVSPKKQKIHTLSHSSLIFNHLAKCVFKRKVHLAQFYRNWGMGWFWEKAIV